MCLDVCGAAPLAPCGNTPNNCQDAAQHALPARGQASQSINQLINQSECGSKQIRARRQRRVLTKAACGVHGEKLGYKV